jgi:hypothetical protein
MITWTFILISAIGNLTVPFDSLESCKRFAQFISEKIPPQTVMCIPSEFPLGGKGKDKVKDF